LIYAYSAKILEAKYPYGGEQRTGILLKGFMWNSALLDVFKKTFPLASQRGTLVPFDGGLNYKQRVEHGSQPEAT
jgi:hypothetical protein